MARGGYRPGAGRPPMSAKEITGATLTLVEGKPNPVEYMLAVMHDPNADPARRDRMAIAAAPYCHTRLADQKISKKALAAEASRKAGKGTHWEKLLESPDTIVPFKR